MEQKKKVKLIDVLAISSIVILFVLFAPKTFLSEDLDKENIVFEEKKNFVEYPLEIKITDKEKQILMEILKVYSIGMEVSNVDFLDGISQNEMVEFCIGVLSEKASSDENITKISVEKSMAKYFDVIDVDYESLGYSEFKTYRGIKAKKIFNITNVIKLEKNSDIYLVYADCVDIAKVHEETYKKEDIEDIYVFTTKKIVEEKKDGNIVHRESRYILQDVEKDINR